MHERIHPTAVIHQRAELDPTVEVGPYCVIGAGVRIGPRCVLHNHVTVLSGTTLGADNVVHPYAVLGAEPQDLKYRGGPTELVVGDRNRIREHATIHRGTEVAMGRTTIGSDCLVMVGVHVGHDCVIEDQVVIANASMIGGHCLIEHGAILGGGVGIHHFTTVGTLSFVAGMSRITKDVPPYVVVEGTPAEPRKINTTALVRRHWSPDDVERLRLAFKLMFRESPLPTSAAIAALRTEAGQIAPVHRLCDFVERMQIGVFGRQMEAGRSPMDRGNAPRES